MEPQMTLTGNLVDDPQHRATASGATRAKFRVACNGRRFVKETGSWEDTQTVFMDVVCWRRLADHVALTLKKGDSVIVRGKFREYSYQASDGSGTKYGHEVEAEVVAPDLNRFPATLSRPPRAAAESHEGDEAAAVDDAGSATANPWGEPDQQVAEPAA